MLIIRDIRIILIPVVIQPILHKTCLDRHSVVPYQPLRKLSSQEYNQVEFPTLGIILVH